VDDLELDELLRRSRRREPAALHELVERYNRRVFGLLYRQTGRRDVAEDLMQETFLRVLRNLDAYEHVGKFESWLFRIAANLARDHARRQKRRSEVDTLDDAALDVEPIVVDGAAAERGDPARQLERAELGDRLVDGLAQLTDADREILLLRHYGEKSFREIADLLGIPLGTALARAHRALGRLRDWVRSDEN
jgi:RNA polymerase sigma-70 factor (ECF subfamily)